MLTSTQIQKTYVLNAQKKLKIYVTNFLKNRQFKRVFRTKTCKNLQLEDLENDFY